MGKSNYMSNSQYSVDGMYKSFICFIWMAIDKVLQDVESNFNCLSVYRTDIYKLPNQKHESKATKWSQSVAFCKVVAVKASLGEKGQDCITLYISPVEEQNLQKINKRSSK